MITARVLYPAYVVSVAPEPSRETPRHRLDALYDNTLRFMERIYQEERML